MSCLDNTKLELTPANMTGKLNLKTANKEIALLLQNFVSNL